MSGHDLGSRASSVAVCPGDTINSFEVGRSLTQCLRVTSMPGPLRLTTTLKKKGISRSLAIPSNMVSGHCTCASSTGRLVMVFIHCLVPALRCEGVQICRLWRICQELTIRTLLLTRYIFFLFEVNKIYQDLNVRISFFFSWKAHPDSQPLFSFSLGEYSPFDIKICFPWRNMPDHANNMKNICEFVSRNICSRLSMSLKSRAGVKARTLKITCLFH